MGKRDYCLLFKSIFVIILIFALAGCVAGRGGKQPDSAATTPPVPVLEKLYSQIYVYEIETTPVLMKDYGDALQSCQSQLIVSLLKRNKYEKVEAAQNDVTYTKPALLVKLKISNMRITSGAARFWGGALAGSSYMYIHMTMVDAETQNVVREEDFNSTNNAFAAAWSFGATDRYMPDDMAEIMAEYIAKAVTKN